MKTDIQLIFRALDLASTRHTNQHRKGKTKTPYINHPIKVATILIDEAGESDPVLIISAILHALMISTGSLSPASSIRMVATLMG